MTTNQEALEQLGLADAAEDARSWLRAALDCKEFIWDADQHEAAEVAYSNLVHALQSTPAATGELPELPSLPEWDLNPYKNLDIQYFTAGTMKKYARRYGRQCFDAALSARTAPVEGATDEQIIAFCERAGLKWIKPLDEDGDCSAFPGGFDITYMRQMRNLLTATTAPVVGDGALDAERYRCLRDRAKSNVQRRFDVRQWDASIPGYGDKLEGPALDSAIDAARAAQ